MNSNSPNRWEKAPVYHKSESAIEKAFTMWGKFMALPAAARIAIVVISIAVLAMGVGTVVGWAFSLLAFIGRLILIALVVAFILSLFRKKK